jgi:hypothetical protein
MYPRSSPIRYVKCVAVAIGITLGTACGHSSQSVAPSALAANPANYDRADVTVTGTVKNPTTHQMRRGTATFYELCDSACINVVQFGDTSVTAGSSVTVAGRFHSSFGRRMVMNNVLVVGGRMRGPGGATP